MKFLRQVLVQDESITVSTTRTDDLPVNPLSVVWVTLRNLNNTADLDDFSNIQNLLTQVSRIEVLYQGSAIVSGSLADLARLYGLLVGNPPLQTASSIVDNQTRSVTVPILLGRKHHWAEECFPAVRRGELQLQTTFAAAQTGVDNLTYQVETTELLGATPARYLKATTISRTWAATGDNDMDLPIGNKIMGVLLFGTTVPTAASFNATWGQVRLMVDNVEEQVAKTNWESLHNSLSLRIREGVSAGTYRVRTNDAAAYAQDALSDGEHAQVGFWDSYALLDLDPHTDGAFALETKGKARIHLRANADVADAARAIPLELVDVSAS